jgi:hypothetical protein
MGCSGSSANHKEDRKIKHEFEATKIPELDDFFRDAGEVLKAGEGIRKGLQDHLEEMIEITAVDALVPAGNLCDAFEVFAWSVSASNGGKVEKAKFKFEEKDPFITYDEEAMNHP